MFSKWTGVIAAAIFAILIVDASAQQRRERQWIELGCHDILTSSQEVGRIRVDVGSRRVDAIQLGAVGSTVRISDFRVVYARGNFDSFPVGQTIRPGNSTLPFDLPGSRELREIEVTFTSQPESRGARRVCAVGQLARVDPRRGEWKEIGCHTVDFNRDLDRFRVAREVGAVSALRLVVRDNPVRVGNFTVGYFGGESETLTVTPSRIEADRRTGRLELKQGPRRIREISLWYHSIDRVGGRAIVCVEGRAVAEPERRPPPDMSKLPDPEPGWERFGCQAVDQAQDTSRIYVGRDRGRFRALQVQAFENGVRVEKLDVTFEDRERKHWEGFWVRKDQNVPLAFEDRAQRIESIEVTYRSADGGGGQAIVCLNGRSTERRTDNTDWSVIGCQPVSTNRDFDVYEVERGDGNFTSVRLHARRNDVSVWLVRLIYETGEAERVSLPEDREINIREGERSDPIDVRDRRALRRIEVAYRADSGGRNEALVCIEGQRGNRRSDDGGRWRRESISVRP